MTNSSFHTIDKEKELQETVDKLVEALDKAADSLISFGEYLGQQGEFEVKLEAREYKELINSVRGA